MSRSSRSVFTSRRSRQSAPGKNKVAAAERRVLALRLRQGGKSYRAIGRELGVSEAQAFRDVQRSLAALGRLEKVEAETFRQLQLERLDAMLCGAFKAASRGDPESVRAVLAVMKHQERLRGVDGSPAVDGLPDFGELRASYLTDRDKLRNLDALLADLWALRDVAVQRITATPLGTDGKAPPALLAVLGEIAGALERVARIEGKIRDRDSISVPVVKA